MDLPSRAYAGRFRLAGATLLRFDRSSHLTLIVI